MKKAIKKSKTKAKKRKSAAPSKKQLLKAVEKHRNALALHVPSAELVVMHKGREKILLNKRLLDRQNCWENLETIKKLHQERLEIEDEMAEIDVFLDLPDAIEYLRARWTENQFKLQDAWKFPRDENFHRFWDIPSCGCPKLDNSDSYPYGRYIRSAACKIHWDHSDKLKKPSKLKRLYDSAKVFLGFSR